MFHSSHQDRLRDFMARRLAAGEDERGIDVGAATGLRSRVLGEIKRKSQIRPILQEGTQYAASIEGFPVLKAWGYDAIAEVVDDFLPRLRADARLGRFWTSPRSTDTNNRERQLAVDFISASAGGPNFYLGREMKTAHQGMGIDREDYAAFMRHLATTLEKFNVPDRESSEVRAFFASFEKDVVEK
jgi:hemoglobin